MKIYTKTGDDGTTSLFRGGRVLKSNPRLEAYGTIDELNAVLGLAVTELQSEEIIDIIKTIQNLLFTLGSDLATISSDDNEKIIRTSKGNIETLEQFIDEIDTKIPVLNNFILPGGSKGASYLHLARTVCRRAERLVVDLSQDSEVNKNVIVFLNRLSDLLFVLSRYENHVNNTPDLLWQK